MSSSSSLRRITAGLVIASAMFLSAPLDTSAQGLNDLVGSLLSGSCGATFTPITTPAVTFGPGGATGALNSLCALTGGTVTVTGGNPIIDTELGQSEAQRRQARRLAERRAGRGGSSADPSLGGLGLFATADYQFLNRDNTRLESGFDQHTAGGTVGADYSFRGRGVLGLAFSYAHEFGDYEGSNGGFDSNAYGPTVFGTITPMENLFIDLFAGYTRKEVTFERGVNVFAGGPTPLMSGRLRADTDSEEFWTGAAIGYDFVIRNFTVGPRVGVNYRDAHVDGFEERGSTGLELIYDGNNVTSLTTVAGIFGSMAIKTPFGALVPQATAEYVHEFENDQRSVGFRFVATPGRPRFVLKTDDPDRDYFNLGLGVVAVFPRGVSAFANVRQLVGHDSRSATTASIGLRVGF